MEKLGSYLKKEREARNCTLEEISNVIKVRKGILRAIENDDYTLLPSPVFIRGFLRAYAKYIGLDPDEVIKRYNQEVAERFTAEEEEEREKRKLSRSFLKVRPIPVAAAFVLLIILLYLVFMRPFSPSQKAEDIPSPTNKVLLGEKGVEMPVASVPIPDKGIEVQEPLVSFPQKEDGTAKAEAYEAKRLNLLFRTKERTWVKITLDGLPPSEVMLRTGETYQVKADRVIELKIGNAGGVDLTLNGKSLPSLGKSGEVVTVTLNEKDLLT